MKLALPAFILSWCIIVIGIGYGIGVRGKDVLGVEFVGGYSLNIGFDQKAKNGGTFTGDHIKEIVDGMKKGAASPIITLS